MWNEFDNRGRSSRPTTPVNDSNQESSTPMVIDDDYYDDKQEGHDNRDNRDAATESNVNENENHLSGNENLLEEDNNLSSENNNLSKSENESLYDSFDDNNTFEVLQKGLYSSDDESSDDGINLTEGNILQYLFTYLKLIIINNY